jgi:hypothetical protein
VANDKRSGMSLPTGILQPTTLPEPVATEQGGDDAPDVATTTRAKTRKKKVAAGASDKTEDMKLYLTEDVRFRLRMLAFKRGTKVSTVANEVLDKALPRWSLERTE